MNKLSAGIRCLIFTVAILFGGVALSTAEEFRLKNDVTVVYEYIPHTQIVSVQAWIKTGSVNEDSGNNGISHFLEHILFKGTKNFAPDEIDKIVESSGGLMNAGTSKDYTTYYVTLPAYNAEVAFKVISDMVFNASFIPEEIEKEKPVVIQEIQRMFDNPTYDMWRDAINLLFTGTPYSMEIIGTEENVNAFAQKTLLEYYRTHYHPQNTTLVIVGDLAFNEAQKLADKYFSVASSAKAAKGYDKVWKPAIKTSVVKTYQRDVAQDYILLAYQLNATAKDAPVYEVLSEILSGGEYSLLNQDLKYDMGVVTAVSAGKILSKNAGGYIVHMVTNPGDADKAVAALKTSLMKLTNGTLSDNELQKAKNRLKSRTVFQKEKASSEAGEIGYSYTLGLKDYYHTYLKRIDAVTMKDVVASAGVIFSSPSIQYSTVPEMAKTAP